MKRVFLAILLVMTSPEWKEKKLIVHRKFLTVSGTTSVGNFTCQYERIRPMDTLFFNSKKATQPFVFFIPVQEFSCGNFLLNRDFRRTIRANEHPVAKVVVSELRYVWGKYSCNLRVDIAGRQLHYTKVKLTKTKTELSARLNINFSDMDMETPKKFGGLIKVEDVLSLHFTLFLQH